MAVYHSKMAATMVGPNVEQDQTDAKWLEKKLVFWRKSQKVCKSLIIVNKSIKKQNIWFFWVMNTKTCIFTFGYRHSWKYCVWCSLGEIKFDLTQKNSNILYALKTIINWCIKDANYVVTLSVDVHKTSRFIMAKSRRFSAKFTNKMRF